MGDGSRRGMIWLSSFEPIRLMELVSKDEKYLVKLFRSYYNYFIYRREIFTMKKQGYYSTGEFMRMTHITKKTIRYYDEQNILKPSYIDPDTRARFYTDTDLARLQQILLLKYLGFSLSDIKVMTINKSDPLLWKSPLSYS